jgi:hypothetical protein
MAREEKIREPEVAVKSKQNLWGEILHFVQDDRL